jgi:signal transduction histidine kinase
MSFRVRLLLAFALTIAATSILASYAISWRTTTAFEHLGDEQTKVLVAQFEREFDWRSREVTRRLDAIATSETVRQLAVDLARPGADAAVYHDVAGLLAEEQSLDFLEILDREAFIVSSAHYPARFGYRKAWVAASVDWRSRGAFVDIEETADGQATALIAVRAVTVAGPPVYLAGGRRLDKEFLDSIPLPPGISADLRIGSKASDAGLRDPIVRIPLAGRAAGAAASLVLSGVRPEVAQLRGTLRWLGISGAVLGLLAGLAVAWWTSARVTRPVRALVHGARKVAEGDWNAHVDVASRDEIGELAHAFNQMTRELTQQRDRLIQVERVAAWRELARRLAHELKNPLFPLQITVENLQRSRSQSPVEFDEVFNESTRTLLAEIGNLKQIVARFSDFAKLPIPRFEQVALHEFFDAQVRLFEAQWKAPGRPGFHAAIDVQPAGLTVAADPELLGRAVRNLILNAMDAMPEGGRLALRAFRQAQHTVLEIEDSGTGLTAEECERLFTPYYTTKHHGTGLGLAIVQSVVADHGGRISVSSAPGRGATFTIELPAARNTDGSPAYS